jgi:hypothetical protein
MVQKLFLFLGLMVLAGSVQAQYKYYEKGLDSYKAGRYDEAIGQFTEYFARSIRKKTRDVEVYYLRALSYHRKAEYKNAIADFDEALRLNHANQGNIYWFRAQCYDGLSEYPEAIGEYTRALRMLGDDKDSQAKLFLGRGKVYLKLRQTDLAGEDFCNGLALNPYHAELIELAAAYPCVTTATQVLADNGDISPGGPWEMGEPESMGDDVPVKKDSVKKPLVESGDPDSRTDRQEPDTIMREPKNSEENPPALDTTAADEENSIPPPGSFDEISVRVIWTWIERHPWLIGPLLIVMIVLAILKVLPDSIKEKWLSWESQDTKEGKIVYEMLHQVRIHRPLLRRRQSGTAFSRNDISALNDSLVYLTRSVTDVLIKLSLKSKAKKDLESIQTMMAEFSEYIAELNVNNSEFDAAVAHDFLLKWRVFNSDLAKEVAKLSTKYSLDFGDFIKRLENG